MDMKKKLLAGTVLSICLLSSGLSACSSEDKTEKPSSENQLQSDYMEVDGILTKTEKGSFSVHAGLMYFTDYETQTSIPICGKPNCRHLSVYEDEKTTCNAVCSSSYMFPYKEKLYRIESVDELYVKNEEGLSNLELSDRLLTDQSWLSGINDITKDGVYFTYQEKYIGEKEIEGDLLMYDAYIEKEDLFGKTGEMKVIYTPRVSSAGNIVTEE